jgi:hypothetical protein
MKKYFRVIGTTANRIEGSTFYHTPVLTSVKRCPKSDGQLVKDLMDIACLQCGWRYDSR